MTEQSLQNRVAIVTGGGRGIGLAIARSIVEAGGQVVIADNGGAINGDGGDPTVAESAARELGGNATAFTQSIASPGAAEALVDRAKSSFGGLDIIVNNAAILRDAFIFKGDTGDWEAVIRTNLSAARNLIAAAAPTLRQNAKDERGGSPYQGGRIVNITSSAGIYGNFGQSAYASAKAGLIGLTRVVAMDLARSGITANAVAPFAATRVTDTIQPANDAQASYKERALKLDASHVANVVRWLASERAQHITGQLFGVRGREVFLFSQPRPIARLLNDEGPWDDANLSEAAAETFTDQYTSLATDLEAFDTEPYI